jgi:hypothetical protein
MGRDAAYGEWMTGQTSLQSNEHKHNAKVKLYKVSWNVREEFVGSQSSQMAGERSLATGMVR